jgi:uncharacterized radical SAM superfamily Fe-S cluster-containing enzyme
MHNENRCIVALPGKEEHSGYSLSNGETKISGIDYPEIKRTDLDAILLFDNNQVYEIGRIESTTESLTLVLTTKCNQKCIMCPQALDVDSLHNDRLLKLILEKFDYSLIKQLYFTGGEPMLKQDLITTCTDLTHENLQVIIRVAP